MPYVYEKAQRGSPFYLDNLRVPSSTVFTETMAQTFEENPVMASSRIMELNEAHRTGRMLTKAEAEERMAAFGVSGRLNINNLGISENALLTLMTRKRSEMRRQELFSRAKGGFLERTGQLGVGISVSLLDPVNVGMAFVPVVGQARYARLLSRAGGTFGKLGVRAGVGAVEGTVGAAAIEPFIYASRRYEQADYEAVDSLMNASFGGIFGASLHTTGGAIRDFGRGIKLSRLRTRRGARVLHPLPPPGLEVQKYQVVKGDEVSPEQISKIHEKYKQSQESGETGDSSVSIEYLDRVPDDQGFEKFYLVNKDGDIVAGVSVAIDNGEAYALHLGAIEVGAGRHLVKELLKRAKELGISKVSLDAKPGTERYHSRAGFRAVEGVNEEGMEGKMELEIPSATRHIERTRQAVDQLVNDEPVNVVQSVPEFDMKQGKVVQFPSDSLEPRLAFDKRPNENWPQAIARIAEEDDAGHIAQYVINDYNKYLADNWDEYKAAIMALEEWELVPPEAYKGNWDSPLTPMEKGLWEQLGVLIKGTRGPDPEIEAAVRSADETPKEIPDDPVEALDEDLANAEAELRVVEKELEVEEPDPDIIELKESVKKSDDWAKAAEVATACLMKGIE